MYSRITWRYVVFNDKMSKDVCCVNLLKSAAVYSTERGCNNQRSITTRATENTNGKTRYSQLRRVIQQLLQSIVIFCPCGRICSFWPFLVSALLYMLGHKVSPVTGFSINQTKAFVNKASFFRVAVHIAYIVHASIYYFKPLLNIPFIKYTMYDVVLDLKLTHG